MIFHNRMAQHAELLNVMRAAADRSKNAKSYKDFMKKLTDLAGA